MNHGIEIVFENDEKNLKLLKNIKGKDKWYSHSITSFIFPFDQHLEQNWLEDCIKILDDNKIPYLKIEF